MATKEAYTEYKGRRYEARIVFYLNVDATEADVETWLEYEIGGGSISALHPLYNKELLGAEISDLRIENSWHYIDWSEAGDNGSRRGRHRIERTPPEQPA